MTELEMKIYEIVRGIPMGCVATYGLKQNNYSGMIQSEVTMDDLFQL